MLIKKQEENKEEESKRASTFGSWVWEKIKNIGEGICVSNEYEATTEGTEERIDIKIHEEKYIMGIEVERTEIECTSNDLIINTGYHHVLKVTALQDKYIYFNL